MGAVGGSRATGKKNMVFMKPYQGLSSDYRDRKSPMTVYKAEN